MNTYKKRNYRKRGYSGRPHRRAADSYHQPLPPEQNRIPYARHTLTKPDVEAVVDALLSGTLTQGRELERFESLLSKLTHSDHAIAFSSGTAAIHGALACLKMEPEDEIITSTLNFCSIANMVRLVGATPVLVDCDPNTLTIDVEGVKAAITENTKAVFANNFGGHAADLHSLRELCDEKNLLLLEDASHGLGGKFRGHYVGNQADLTCFSFHPSKAITTCEGGAVTTNNRAIAEWLRLFRHHGIQKDSRYFQTDEDYPSYFQELQFQGMNYRLSEIHAALGRSQLTRLDRHIERRRSIAQVYYQKLGNMEELILPYSAEWADSAFHLYPIQLTGSIGDKRNVLFQDLKTAAIDTQVHYVPVHRMPLYAGKLGAPEQFPNAETYFGRALSLPLFPDLSYKEIERITELLTRFITKYLNESKAYVPEDTADVEEALEEASAIEAEAEMEAMPDEVSGDSSADADAVEPEEQAPETESCDDEPVAEAAPSPAEPEPVDPPAPAEEPAAEAAPEVEEAPVVEETPATEQAPAAEEIPSEEKAPVAEEAPEKEAPKPKRTRKPRAKKTATGDDAPAKKTTTRRKPTKAAAVSEGEEAEKKPTRRRTTRRTKKDDAEETPARKPRTRKTAAKSSAAADGEEKPKPRRTRKAKPKAAEPEAEAPSAGSDEG